MRVGQVKPTALLGPYADGSNRSFTITAPGVRATRNPNERGPLHVVRKPNRKGGDRRLRPRQRWRPARMLLRDRDGGVAVRGVRPGGDVLRHVLGGLLLVDGLRSWAGPIAVVCPPGTTLHTPTGGPHGVRGLPEGVARATKAVMTRAELGGALFVAAVIGVLLASRAEGDESSHS
jgi:hypothetical protein